MLNLEGMDHIINQMHALSYHFKQNKNQKKFHIDCNKLLNPGSYNQINKFRYLYVNIKNVKS